MPFCTNCGTALAKPVRFCTSCGQPLPAGAGPTAPVPPAGDTVIGVIGGLDRKISFLSSEPVNLVITSTRTLCVPVSGLLEAALKKAESEAQAEGKWILGRWKARAEVWKAANFSGHFRGRPGGDILREFPGSIDIPHTVLTAIMIRHRVLDLEGEDISSSAEDWPIAINAGASEYTLTAKTDPVPQFRLNPAVDAVIGDRIKVLF